MRSILLIAAIAFLFFPSDSTKITEFSNSQSDSLATKTQSEVRSTEDSASHSKTPADTSSLLSHIPVESREYQSFWELVGKISLLAAIFGGAFVWLGRKLFKLYNLKSHPYLQTIARTLTEYERYQNIDFSIVSNGEEERIEIEKQRFTLSEALNSAPAIQILGKPGSGKTTALKKLLCAYAANELTKKPWKRTLPVYIEYRGESLFAQMVHFLHVNGLGTDIKFLDEKWLRNQLSKGRFLVLIDDVHKILENQDSKDQSKLQELLDYNSNKFVLMSRDFFKRSDFGFDLYQVSSLTDDQVVQILNSQTNNTNTDEIFRHIRWNRRARELYDTPQMLSFLAKAFEISGRMPLNKSHMFQQFFASQVEQEEIKGAKYVGIQRKRLLGSLALAMLKRQADPYRTNENECLQLLNESISKLNSRYGYATGSSTDALEEFLRAGTLIRYDENIKFQHDQWQEYFAATEAYVEEVNLDSLRHLQSYSELAYFITGLHSLDDNDALTKTKCKVFLNQLVKTDFFLFSKCLENFESDKRLTLGDWHDFYKDVTFSFREIEDLYGDFLNQYVEIIRRQFPNLYSKFSPKTDKSIGIFVEKKEPKWANWYAFFEVKSEDGTRVIVVDRNHVAGVLGVNEENKLLDFYTRQYGPVNFKARDIDPVLYKLPVIGAHDEIRTQLKELVRHKDLVEPLPMMQECLYFEAVALRYHLGIPRDKTTLSVKDISDGLRRKQISESIFHRFVSGNSVDVRGLNEETERLFLEEFVPERRAGSTTYAGIYSRSINDKKFEDNFTSFVRRTGLKSNDVVIPPLAILPREYHLEPPSIRGDADRDRMIEWSVDYFSKLYSCYKEMIETNFPESTKSFETYAHLPIVVALVIDSEKFKQSGWLGSRHVFGNVNSSKSAVTIEIIKKERFPEYESTLRKHRWSEYPFWGIHHRSPNGEILRNGVYEIIEKEFNQLVR